MGDTGSLALGAGLAGMAIATKMEILLLLIGGLFVVEALSVMIQVFSFRVFHRRVFLMAPIHHHFELKGWSETKIIVRFWISRRHPGRGRLRPLLPQQHPSPGGLTVVCDEADAASGGRCRRGRPARCRCAGCSCWEPAARASAPPWLWPGWGSRWC